ncbi:MAG: M23 family metallopeptidase [Lewinellaceae bacterium]|nr:M23 family metallopeptidase [Lewinellaceae bacterium]
MKMNVLFAGVLFFALAGQMSSCEKDPEAPLTCLERAQFGDPKASPYILPFPVGKTYVLSQTYCNPTGGHSGQLAYDFALSIGDPVTAARQGVVKEIRADVPDNGTNPNPGDHNHVFIQHTDGSVAFYAHLQQNSVLVKAGDQVQAGTQIASSGNSGNTGGFPHLHFGVYEEWPPVEGFDLPINFKNANGPLDGRGGLVADQWYEALAY